MPKRKRIIILGATGSIGDSTLKLVRAAPERFEIVAMSAHQNTQKLMALAQEFRPQAIALTHDKGLSPDTIPVQTILHTGSNAACDILEYEADIVVAAMMGASGVAPVMKAIKRGFTVALANKEALVCAGQFMMDACKQYNTMLLPIDSEHNAIYQLLQGESHKHIHHITLTASGGPFLSTPLDELAGITPSQAVAHPKWSMGHKISIDSATMMNKGLECIEAHWLFGLPADKIHALIHPQAVMHGMVAFEDGSTTAHMGATDMCIPISYCLYAPERASLPQHSKRVLPLNEMHFLPIEKERYPAFYLSMDALRAGLGSTICLNAANEIAVAAFLNERIGFTDIVRHVALQLEYHTGHTLNSIEDVLAWDAEIRIKTEETLSKATQHYA